jgi:MerR family mercuric resistance operon transcriptional regulator
LSLRSIYHTPVLKYDGTHCDQTRQFGEQKLADVRAKLADLHRIEVALSTLVNDCCASQGAVACPLIAALQEQPSAARDLDAV